MAIGLFNALKGIEGVDEVVLASELRSRDGVGSVEAQARMLADSKAEIARILESKPDWDGWFTYHNYYKAPDLIGPSVAKALGIPYFIAEASRSPKRAQGPWAGFAALAEAASDAADAIFYFTQRDFPQLDQLRPDAQQLVHLRPFLDKDALPYLPKTARGREILSVGMLREGDKTDSYKNLSRALHVLNTQNWTLRIIGDGPARREIEALFAPFGDRVIFEGAVAPERVLQAMQQARVFAWPGVNEAFGMVYLEAQSVGLPVVAQDRPGVRDVVGPQSRLVPMDDPVAFAAGLEHFLECDWDPAPSCDYIAQSHLRPSAQATLERVILPRIGISL